MVLLLRYCRDVRGMALERLSIADIDAPLVEAFLDHLSNDRHASIPTRNHRLAALHAFFRYVRSEVPEHLLQCQQILAIPLRRHARPIVGYLSKEYLAEILAQRFKVTTACCKTGGIEKEELGLEKTDEARTEAMCNPAGQGSDGLHLLGMLQLIFKALFL